MKRGRNGEIWDFEHQMPVALGATDVILGLDGGTTSTVCICMPLIPYSDTLPDRPHVLARAVAGCSNHNSVGGNFTFNSLSLSLSLNCQTFFFRVSESVLTNAST